MRELLAAAAVAALLGSAARAGDQDRPVERLGDHAAAPAPAPAKASAARKKDAAPRKAGAGRANEKKPDARKPGVDPKPAGAEAGRKNPDPCEPVKPCPID